MTNYEIYKEEKEKWILNHPYASKQERLKFLKAKAEELGLSLRFRREDWEVER